MARKKHLKTCPNCNNDTRIGYMGGVIHFGAWCPNCRWNDWNWNKDKTRKELYQYWYRLYRILHRPHQTHPPKWKQPLDLLKDGIFEMCARRIPNNMRPHFDDVFGWRFSKDHHWIFASSSRWEYHLWLRDGHIKNWKEYENAIKARREYEAENMDYSAYYDEPEY